MIRLSALLCGFSLVLGVSFFASADELSDSITSKVLDEHAQRMESENFNHPEDTGARLRQSASIKNSPSTESMVQSAGISATEIASVSPEPAQARSPQEAHARGPTCARRHPAGIHH